MEATRGQSLERLKRKMAMPYQAGLDNTRKCLLKEKGRKWSFLKIPITSLPSKIELIMMMYQTT